MRRRGRFALSCLYSTTQHNTIQYSIAAPVALGNLRRGAAPAAHTMAVAAPGAVRHTRAPQLRCVLEIRNHTEPEFEFKLSHARVWWRWRRAPTPWALGAVRRTRAWCLAPAPARRARSGGSGWAGGPDLRGERRETAVSLSHELWERLRRPSRHRARVVSRREAAACRGWGTESVCPGKGRGSDQLYY